MQKLTRFLRPYSGQLAAIAVLAFGQALLNLYLPNLMADIIDNGVVKGDTAYIWRIGAVMLVVTVGATLAAVGGMFYSARVGMSFGKDLRDAIFDLVQRFSLRAFDQLGTSSLITRTTNDTTQVQLVLVLTLGTILSAPLTMVAGIVLALREDVGLAWVLVVAVPILAAAILLLLSKTVPLYGRYQDQLDQLNLVVDEGLTGVRVIRAFNRERHEEARFDRANRELTDLAITVNRLLASLWPTMQLVLNTTMVAIVWFGSRRVAARALHVGLMMAVTAQPSDRQITSNVCSVMITCTPMPAPLRWKR